MNSLKELDDYQKRYGVLHNGVYALFLNPYLVSAQKLNDARIEMIKRIHQERLKVFDAMENCYPPFLKIYAKVVEIVEFALQTAWGFCEDDTKHSWWYEVPHCVCPKTANAKLFGEPHRIINRNCPVHGE